MLLLLGSVNMFSPFGFDYPFGLAKAPNMVVEFMLVSLTRLNIVPKKDTPKMGSRKSLASSCFALEYHAQNPFRETLKLIHLLVQWLLSILSRFARRLVSPQTPCAQTNACASAQPQPARCPAVGLNLGGTTGSELILNRLPS